MYHVREYQTQDPTKLTEVNDQLPKTLYQNLIKLREDRHIPDP